MVVMWGSVKLKDKNNQTLTQLKPSTSVMLWLLSMYMQGISTNHIAGTHVFQHVEYTVNYINNIPSLTL